MTVVTGGMLNDDVTVGKLKIRLDDVEMGLIEAKKHIEQEQRVKQQAIAAAKKKNAMELKTSLYCLLVLLGVIGLVFVVQAIWYPSPPSTAHLVHLIEVNGTYGLKLEGRVIEEIVLGGAADLQGELKKGDEIMEINGYSLTKRDDYKVLPELISQYFKTSNGEVQLLVRNVFNTV